jgi:hypothetical protein
VGGACSPNGGKEKFVWVIGGKESTRNQNIGGFTILEWIFRKIGWGSVDWIGLAQDRHKWRALVNAVMNLRVP